MGQPGPLGFYRPQVGARGAVPDVSFGIAYLCHELPPVRTGFRKDVDAGLNDPGKFCRCGAKCRAMAHSALETAPQVDSGDALLSRPITVDRMGEENGRTQ